MWTSLNVYQSDICIFAGNKDRDHAENRTEFAVFPFISETLTMFNS